MGHSNSPVGYSARFFCSARVYTKLGLEPKSGSAEEMAKLIADDYARWEPIIKTLKIGK